MKTGCLWALITWVGTIVILVCTGLIAQSLGGLQVDPERLGDVSSRIGLFLGFVVFVVVWIFQANRRERQRIPPPKPPPPPEHLDPIDYSKLSQIFDDTDHKP